MKNRFLLAALALSPLIGLSIPTLPDSAAVTVGAQPPERAIRRTIPMNKSILRAIAKGTRDSSGKPGKNYWQTWVDYNIKASLDPKTNRVKASEKVTVTNRSDTAVSQLTLRLDQNYFRG